jgi:hypothetical protein
MPTVNRFKLERSSSSGNSHCGPSPDSQNLAALAAANVARARSSNPSGAVAAVHEQGEQQQQYDRELSGGGFAHVALQGPSEAGDADGCAAGGQQGRWREGKMGTELKRMQDRLANLQSIYQQQVQGRQKPPGIQETPVAEKAAAESVDGALGGLLESALRCSSEVWSSRSTPAGPGLRALGEQRPPQKCVDTTAQQQQEPEHTPDSSRPRQAEVHSGAVALTAAGASPSAAESPAAPATEAAAPAIPTPSHSSGTPPGVASKRAAVVARLSAVASLSRAGSATSASLVASRESDQHFSTPAEHFKSSAGGQGRGSSTTGSSASPLQLLTPLPLVLEQSVAVSSGHGSHLADAEASTGQPGAVVATAAEPTAATASLEALGQGHDPAAATAGWRVRDVIPLALGQAVVEPATTEALLAPPAVADAVVNASSSSACTPGPRNVHVNGKSSAEAGPPADPPMVTHCAAGESAHTPLVAAATPGTVGATSAPGLQALEVGMVEYNNPCYDMTPGSALPVGAIPFSSLVSQVKHSA